MINKSDVFTQDILFQTKDIFQVPVENIFKSEKQSIVQMDLIKETLLVSTNEKVVLVNMQTKYSIPIGTKQRWIL